MDRAKTLKVVGDFIVNVQRVAGSPGARAALQLLKPILPTWGLTPEQIAGLDHRFADAGVRKARAKKRAGQS